MPSPKWKLVVDIGVIDESTPAPALASSLSTDVQPEAEMKDSADLNLLASMNPTPPSTSGSLPAELKEQAKDSRIDEIVCLLGEIMPSDPTSSLATYVPGFMSLRLLLLRPSRTAEEEELVKTILDSFSSYTSGGRERSTSL